MGLRPLHARSRGTPGFKGIFSIEAEYGGDRYDEVQKSVDALMANL